MTTFIRVHAHEYVCIEFCIEISMFYLFQIIVRLLDIQQSKKLKITIPFEKGEWFHTGWSLHNNVTRAYKNGCLYQMKSSWADDTGAYSAHDGVLFSGQDQIDLQFDELYLWEVSKPASVFAALWAKAF